jgi:hypothetical protein
MSPFEHGEVFVLDDGGEVGRPGFCSMLPFRLQKQPLSWALTMSAAPLQPVDMLSAAASAMAEGSLPGATCFRYSNSTHVPVG